MKIMILFDVKLLINNRITTMSEVKFVHGDFFGSIFMLIFSIKKVQVRVNLTKFAINFPQQSMFEIKNQLTKEQFESLMNQCYDFIKDLN
jgi:hypothetical protein